MSEKLITITQAEYASLLDDAFMLRCLYSAGVGNWEKYYFALEEYDGKDDEGAN